MLSKHEKLTLATWLEGHPTHATFDSFLFQAIQVNRADYTGPGSTLAAAALDLMNWLDRNTSKLVPLYTAIVHAVPSDPLIAELTATLARLQSLEAAIAAAGPRYAACCPGGMPVVNRSPLRGFLQQLEVDPSRYPVVVVAGERGLGRSHSWYLIDHVADSLEGRVKLLHLDLAQFGLKPNALEQFFTALTRVTGLTQGSAPDTHGVTAATLADRYTEEFHLRIQALQSPLQKPWPQHLWFVFDSIDNERVPPEMKHFIMQLAAMRLKSMFGGCTLFLLGPDPTVALHDIANLARYEQLGPFQEHEIVATASAINNLGVRPLDAVSLQSTIQSMHSLPGAAKERTAAICGKMVALRMTVGLP